MTTFLAAGTCYFAYSAGKSVDHLIDHFNPKSNPKSTLKKSDAVGVELQDRLETASVDPLHAIAEQTSQKGVGGVLRYDGVRLRCNEPTEDRATYEVFSSPWSETEPSWSAWGVFDGHLGWQMSEYLSKRLLSIVRICLGNYCENILPPERSSPASSETVENAIKKAFKSADQEILNLAKRAVENPRTSLVEASEKINLAYAGSCAIVSFFDPTTHLLHVACTGDCRAVLGRRTSDESNVYTAIPLSDDQTGRNGDEVSRLQREHPNEPEMVQDGRVLGLAVSRAFGDFQWKFDEETQKAIRSRFFRFVIRPHLRTPPYLTSEPVVTTTKVSQDGGDFLIMASDGFWDSMSSEDAVELVRKWKAWKLSGSREPIGPKDEEIVRRRDSPPASYFQKANTVVKDENVAIHLLRNALDGGDEEHMKALLSFKAPQARSMRDDITIQVVFFEDPNVEDKLDHPTSAKSPTNVSGGAFQHS